VDSGADRGGRAGETARSARPAAGFPAEARLAGVLLMLAAIMSFVVMDTTIKTLTVTMPLPLLLWGRFSSHLVAVLALRAALGRPAFAWPKRPAIQAARSLLLLATTGLFALAVRHLPLADATAITFVSPLLLTLLGARMLGERVGPRRWAAVLVGFAGVLVVIRPGLDVTHPAAGLALAAATSLATYQALTRKLAGHDDALTTLLHTAFVATLLLTPLAPFFWQPLSAPAWALLAMTGAVGAFGHFLLIAAFQRAPASLLAPFVYTQLGWSVLSGWQVFGDLPDAFTLVGGLVIAAAGLAVLAEERRFRISGRG